MKHKTTIVIPVYNEGENISSALTAIRQEVRGDYTIAVVYDDESDTTLPALDKWERETGARVDRIRNRYGRGALNAIRTGMETADSEYVVVTMADLSDPPSVINEMIRKADEEKADIVCASRYMKGGRQIGGPLLKGLMSRCAGLSLNALAGLPTHDPTNSFKLYRKRFLDKMTVESTGGFELGLELVVKAWKNGYKVTEVPTVWRDRPNGKSNFKLWKWLPHYLHWYFLALRGKNDPMKENGNLVRIGGIVLFLLFLITHLPDPEPLLMALEQGGLDPSWIKILCHAHQQGFQFGRDVIFTYGPLGYLLFPYDPATLFLSSLFSVALLLPFGFIFLAKRTFTSSIFLLLFTIVSIFSSPYIANPSYEVFIFLFPILIWYLLEIRKPWIRYGSIAYTVILGTICVFVKFMCLPVMLFSLVITDLLMFRRHKIILALPVFLLALPLAWCFFARQEISNLYSFFIYSWQIASGYNHAMAIGPGADSPLWIPLFFFETAAIFVLALFANRENNSGRPVFDKICRAILPLPTLLIACKYGIVRMDYVHIIPAVRFMILIAVFCSAVPEKMALKWRCALLLSALLPTACVTIHYGGNMLAKECPSVLILFLSALLIYILNRYAVTNHVPRIIRLSFSTVFIVLAVHKIFLPWIFEQIGHYRSFSNHTPVVTAGAASSPVTADCFSHEMYLFRFNIRYSPRFVFQSYSAYTPELIRKNAAHFEYNEGPDYIFFGLQEIDGKFPTSFDSLSLLRIMNNYEPVPGNMLLRKKKNRPSPVCLEEIEKVESGFDCVIDLPRNAPYVWGSLDFHNSAAGFLLKNIIKPPSVVMRFTLENGQNISKIINPETSSVPFLLSPFLPSWRHLDILLSPGIKILPRVVRFSVYPYFYCFSYDGWSTPEPYFPSGEKWDREIGGFFFKDGFTVRFYRMVYSSPDKEENARP